jgi:hypothetical protein
VPGFSNSLDKMWKTLGYPSQKKKCGATFSISQYFQDFFRIPLYATLVLIPMPPAHGRIKTRYLEMLLNIERHAMNGGRTDAGRHD